MKWIDIPPAWLVLHLVAVWVTAPHAPLRTDSPSIIQAGSLCIGLGLALALIAVATMSRARTTAIPHRQPASLVTSGVFGWSRNPIYLGDALILAGAVLRAQAPILLLAVPVFVWVITRRFIEPEEARLEHGFGSAFEAYRSRTRRWI
jgi:protein-S-isoprenylcysteine O-methyltransferase Ste14